MLTLLPYTDALAPHFRAINAAWIAEMFTLEPHDEHVLDHPREAIVDPGGVILFAHHAEHGIVGTGALMPVAPRIFELTKMGVTTEHRGTGAGAALLAGLLDRARAMPVDTLFLLTSSKCQAAIRLYERAGFRHDAAILREYGGTYARCDVAMRYPLPAR